MNLRGEVNRYRHMLAHTKQENSKKMAALMDEERLIKEENLRLQRKLQMETERREALCRHLSESESSLEMDDERHFNELAKSHEGMTSKDSSMTGPRSRTVSSPIPYHNTTPAKTITPTGSTVSPPAAMRCNACGHIQNPAACGGASNTNMSCSLPSMSPPATPGFFIPPHSTSSSTALHHAAVSGSSTPTTSNSGSGQHSSSSHHPHQRPNDRFAKPPLPGGRP